MEDNERMRSHTKMECEIEEMQLKNDILSHDTVDRIRPHKINEELVSRFSSPKTASSDSSTHSSLQSRTVKGDHEETVGGDVIFKHEPGYPPKLARTSSQKITSRAAPLLIAYADKTGEAKDTFSVIPGCIYSNKSIGSTEQAMECDCAEEWDSSLNANVACGEDSDCINRATKMECVDDCGCGSDCQNQRFQRRQYANVAVIQTEKKGYGLRADSDLQAHDFIFEYVGEVINENHFRRRMIQYDEEGIKHFYFMSLSKGEFVDATKKGNLGRFCNHSCNPNCYVDKWVVGDKLRMGIFAERNIKAGEELVFNYNVDRYGANPQPCYCGEPNCTGFIGGKTQTERATKLSNLTIEALGIDDGDGWDTAVARKPRKKKAGEDDEEYVNNVQPKSLDEEGVTKVMATLLQCKEKWIAVKLLGRIQRCDNERVRNRVVKMHGYQILNSALALWKDDFNVVLQILDILDQFPRLTRNKISDSKIESTIESLKSCGDERVESQSIALLKEWSILEVGYRIPRKKRDIHGTNTPDKPDHFGRRDTSREDRKAGSISPSETRSRSRSRSIDAPRGPAAPNGPRIGVPQRNATFYPTPRPPYRPRPFNALPSGWFTATSNGSTYFYSATGQTTWTRPTMPAAQPPPPPKPVSNTKALEDIINNITNAKANTPKDKSSKPATLQLSRTEAKGDKKDGKEKWRSYSEEKQKKLYENTLFPHIKYVMDKYKSKLPRDDLKRFAKDISKKLVNSDYKNHRVEDPTRISSRQEKQVKKHVKEFFDKAVAKKKEYDKKKAERKGNEADVTKTTLPVAEIEIKKEDEESDVDPDLDVSDDDDTEMRKPETETPITPIDQVIGGDGLKRKREDTNGSHVTKSEDDATPSKRLRSETPPPPPPPPPPPADSGLLDQSPDIDQLMGDDLAEAEYPKSQNHDFDVPAHGPIDDITPIKETLAMELDLASPPHHPSFHIARPASEQADTSDSAPSPTLLEPLDLTPIDSESEGFERREQSYTGLDLNGVRELEVRDGI